MADLAKFIEKAVTGGLARVRLAGGGRVPFCLLELRSLHPESEYQDEGSVMGRTFGVRALAFDGQRMELVRVEAESGRGRRLLQRSESEVLVEGEWVGIQDATGMVRLWNLRTDEVISLGVFESQLLDFAHSLEGDRVALALEDRALVVDVPSGARRNLSSPLRLPVWGDTLLDAPEDGTVRIFRDRTPASPRAFFEAIDRLTRVRVAADELR